MFNMSNSAGTGNRRQEQLRQEEEMTGEFDSPSRDIGFGPRTTSGVHHYSINTGYTVSVLKRVFLI